MKNNLPAEWIERIFMRLHGRFGNSFLEKFRIGKLNDAGEDIGIANAKQVWSEELADISSYRIKNALSHNYEFAPSCDQFKAQCKTTIASHQDFLQIQRKFTPEEIECNRQKLKNIMENFCKTKPVS